MGVEAEVAALKDIVRIGTVSSVDMSSRTARVVFPDKNDMVSGSLKIVKQEEIWLPAVGQAVLCLYLPNGESDGFVIGGI